MKRWHKAIIVIVSTLIVVFPISKNVMSSEPPDNTSKYRVEYVPPEDSQLKVRSGDTLRDLNQQASLLATVKVAKEGYTPPGVEIRTWISPLIFTANIPREILNCLEDDPVVVSIEPVYQLRAY